MTTVPFRAAINGFNREDVVNYIDNLSSQNEKTVKALQAENARLQAELDAVRIELASAWASQEEPPPAEPAPAPAPAEDYSAKELEAYRRAEAAERNAFARADTLYAAMDAICNSTLEQFESSAGNAMQLQQELSDKLQQLQQSLSGLRATIHEAGDSLRDLTRAGCEGADGCEDG